MTRIGDAWQWTIAADPGHIGDHDRRKDDRDSEDGGDSDEGPLTLPVKLQDLFGGLKSRLRGSLCGRSGGRVPGEPE